MSSKAEPHTFRDDIDFESLQIIGFDHAGTYEHFKKQQTDIYEIILEIIANATDSKNLGEPNKITISRNKHPAADPDNDPVLEVKDGGAGIAMDYDGNVLELTKALKANSRKRLHKHRIGSKGIGMLQFTNISSIILFTSMYNGLIARFALLETKSEGGEEDRHRRVPAFSDPRIEAASEKNKENFKIYENGTKVSFYDRNERLGWIQPKTLMDKIAKEYAIRLAENEKLEIFVNGKRVHAPPEYREHPPGLLFKTSKGYEVRGAIWANPKGHGNAVLFRGHRVVDQYIDLRQCEGYAECWELEPDTSRVSFVDNETTKEVVEGIRKIMKQFPSIKDDPEHKKQMEDLRQMASLMLADIIPPMPIDHGSQNDKTKQEQHGDLNGTGSAGHRPKKEPDPTREIKRRKGGKHKKHHQVGRAGTDQVMMGAKDESKRQQEHQLYTKEVDYGSDKPLMKLFNDGSPALLTINKDNDEYRVYKETFQKDIKSYKYLLAMWISEVYHGKKEGGISDQTRFELSQYRVMQWRIIGRYPVVRMTAPLTAGRM